MGVPKHAQCLAEGVRPERKSVIIVGIYIIELVLSPWSPSPWSPWSCKNLLWCLLCFPMAAWPGRLPPLSWRPALIKISWFRCHDQMISIITLISWLSSSPVHTKTAALFPLPLSLLVAGRQDEVSLTPLPEKYDQWPSDQSPSSCSSSSGCLLLHIRHGCHCHHHHHHLQHHYSPPCKIWSVTIITI